MRLVGDKRKRLFEGEIGDRAEYGAPQRADAAKDRHHQEFARPLPGHEGGRDEFALVGEQRPGDAGDRAGDHAGGELKRERPQADRPGARGILPDRVESAAEARPGDPRQQDIGERERG